MECGIDVGKRSQGYVCRVLAVSCRMKEIKGVGTVQLVCIDRLMRMGSDYLLEMGSLAREIRLFG